MTEPALWNSIVKVSRGHVPPTALQSSLEKSIDPDTGGLSQGAVLQQLRVESKPSRLSCMHYLLTLIVFNSLLLIYPTTNKIGVLNLMRW